MMRMNPILLFLAIALHACAPKEPTIDFGKAECAHCRMNVVDRQYGAAIVTAKGREYVFDDMVCMVRFVHEGTVSEDQVASWHVCDYAKPGALIDATRAFYLTGPAFRSPMRGDLAAFADEAARTAAQQTEAQALDWNAVRQILIH